MEEQMKKQLENELRKMNSEDLTEVMNAFGLDEVKVEGRARSRN